MVGAHPSYPDRANFGRTALAMRPDDLASPSREPARGAGGCRRGHPLRQAARGAAVPPGRRASELARAVADAVVALSDRRRADAADPRARSSLADAAAETGLPFVREAFLDRGYLPDGGLVPRDEPGALLADPALVARRAVRLARDGVVEAIDGRALVEAAAASLCVHGDSPAPWRWPGPFAPPSTTRGIEVRAPW